MLVVVTLYALVAIVCLLSHHLTRLSECYLLLPLCPDDHSVDFWDTLL